MTRPPLSVVCAPDAPGFLSLHDWYTTEYAGEAWPGDHAETARFVLREALRDPLALCETGEHVIRFHMDSESGPVGFYFTGDDQPAPISVAAYGLPRTGDLDKMRAAVAGIARLRPSLFRAEWGRASARPAHSQAA